MKWKCHYGCFRAESDRFDYVVTKQWRRGEMMWFALMHDRTETPPTEVPGPLPLNRRQAMRNCEEHAEGVRS